MRSLLLLLTTLASALPDREEARHRLGSGDFEERQALTMEFWEAGGAAIPLLEQLRTDPDPEVANRADFVLKRLMMGLGPDAPDELLQLATKAEQSSFEARSSRIGDLLEHPAGFSAALVLLDRWITDKNTPHDHRLSLTHVFIESLLEQRKDWRKFLTTPLSARTRAYLIGTLCHQDSPVKDQMIAILANDDLRSVHQFLVTHFKTLPQATHLTLARLAVIHHDPALALETLSHSLAHSDSPDPARALAYLEKSAGLPPFEHHGRWLQELNLFRARAHQDDPETSRLAALVTSDASLIYESGLISGALTLPTQKEATTLSGSDALESWHLAFGSPPEEPDIEALTSSVLIDWPVLVRTLTALAHPIEAAERLTAESQITSAVGLLWRTGHRTQALTLSQSILASQNEEHHLDVRLTLASLFLEAGEKEKAANFFKPLLKLGISEDLKRRKAIALALRIFPIDEVTVLEPALTDDRAFRRQRAIPPFLPFPPPVSAYWYEHFYALNPRQSPAATIRQVEQFLTTRTAQARKIIARELLASTAKTLLPTDTLYQNALFLKLPEALPVIKTAAWYQLETRDLLSIVRSNEWPPETRRKALDTALALDPTDPILRWNDLQLNGNGDPSTITWATLGNPSLALQLANLTGTRETLATTVRIASFNNPATLQGLGILGRSHFQNQEPALAARLLLSSLLGEIALGTRSSSSIQNTLDILQDLFRARLQTAATDDEKTIWRERLRRLNSPLPPQE